MSSKLLLAGYFLSIFLGTPPALVAEPPDQTLTQEVLEADQRFFSAFNRGDLETTRSMLDPNIEFYHDKDGQTGFDETVAGLKRLFGRNNGLNRQLISDQGEVHPIPNVGAVQLGSHRFCHDENGKQDCGVFKFVHLWRKTEDGWKLSRVISYDH